MSTKRILVIESETDFAESLVLAFSNYDTKVSVISDGKEGMQAAKSKPPDLVLLRVELPRMSGYSICTKLKRDKKLKKVPLIIMSSEATEETFEQHRKLKTRAEDYIIKPFEFEDLITKVRSQIELPDKSPPKDLLLPDSLDDDESIELNDDETFSIEKLTNLDDFTGEEEISLVDAADVDLLSSPLDEDDPDLEKFEEAFGDLGFEDTQIPDDSPSSDEMRDQEESDRQIADFDDVLSSLEADDEDPSEDDEQDDELDLSVLDDLDLTGEAEAKDNHEPDDEEVIEDDLLDGLELDDDPLAADEESEQELAPAPTAEEMIPSESDQEPPHDIDPPQVPIPEETPGTGQEPTPEENSRMGLKAEDEPVPVDPEQIQKLERIEAENSRLKEQIETLKDHLQAATQTRDSEIGNLRSKSTSKDKETLELRTALNEKEREILNFKEIVNTKDREILDAQQQSVDLESKISEMDQLIATRESELSEQKSKFQALSFQKDELENSLSDTHNQLEAAKQATQNSQQELKETIQRHTDEIYGLRARSKDEHDQLQANISNLTSQLDDVKGLYQKECEEHEQCQQQAVKVPGLESDLEHARASISHLQQEVANLQAAKSDAEERVLQAYRKIKDDEHLKDKARKAIEIANTLLADEIAGMDESQNPVE
jgi:DNA-binding response OmpR family regulator/predicted  nucleic acid-binding Zn-ribbon protein